MIEGIDYFPAKRRKRPSFKKILTIFILIFLVIFIALKFNKNQKKSTNNVDQTFITISVGESQEIETTSKIVIDSSQTFEFVPPVISVKTGQALDEVITNYSTQNP
jgi:uncharacterized membrane protein YvbJ